MRLGAMEDDVTELVGVSAVEIARRVRAGDVSPGEVLDSTLAAIGQLNSQLNAFVHVGEEDARRTAETTAGSVASGAAVGALAGVPTAMKDLYNMYPGWPSTFGGIPALRDFIPNFATTYPRRMEAAGATVVGATNSPVMGFRGTCDNELFGPTHNPFDLTRNSGGSSGGSAAAVAAGIVPIAGGTDGGGSLRIPAAWSGVFGYQASWGRIPLVIRPNAFAVVAPFAYEGPITRTVADAALAMNALAGFDSADPFSIQGTVDWSAALDSSIEGKRIGYTRDFGVFAVDSRIAAGVEEALSAFEEQGAILVPLDIDLPFDQAELSALWCRMICNGNVGTINGFESLGFSIRDQLPAQLQEWMRVAEALPVAAAHADQIMRTTIYDMLEGALADVDLIASPTVGALPVPNANDGNTVGPSEIEGIAVDPLIGWCLTYFTNFSGHPAASLPAGLIEGLPFGLQLIGRRYDDFSLMAASARFEEARPWSWIYDQLDPALTQATRTR